uniref:Uncharacterized protein n=1 Tax=Salix viminalis TaxID=40686 RepID=A0A6N2L6I9_SALVM
MLYYNTHSFIVFSNPFNRKKEGPNHITNLFFFFSSSIPLLLLSLFTVPSSLHDKQRKTERNTTVTKIAEKFYGFEITGELYLQALILQRCFALLYILLTISKIDNKDDGVFSDFEDYKK